MRLCPGKQLLILKTRTVRCVQISLGLGFFWPLSFSVIKLFYVDNWGSLLRMARTACLCGSFSCPPLPLQELKQHFLADMKGRSTSLVGRRQCPHCSPRNSQSLPKHGDPLASVLWSAAFTVGHRLGCSYNFNEKSSEKFLVTVREKQVKRP